METIEKYSHVIDLNQDAPTMFGDRNCRPIIHRKMGNLIWDPDKIKLVIPETQRSRWYWGNYPPGNMVYRNAGFEDEKTSPKVLNVSVLNYLLDNPQLIPEGWKPKQGVLEDDHTILFWGTLYDVEYQGHGEGSFTIHYQFVPALCYKNNIWVRAEIETWGNKTPGLGEHDYAVVLED